MERCVRDLEPADWFGRDWDALPAVLADLPAASPDGVLLAVTHWTGYAQARPEEWRIAQEVFADAVERAGARRAAAGDRPRLPALNTVGGSADGPADRPG